MHVAIIDLSRDQIIKVLFAHIKWGFLFLLFMFRVCHAVFGVHCSLVVSWWKGLTSWLSCVFVTFPCGVLCQVWYLILSIPDLSFRSYFSCDLAGRTPSGQAFSFSQSIQSLPNSHGYPLNTQKAIQYCGAIHLLLQLITLADPSSSHWFCRLDIYLITFNLSNAPYIVFPSVVYKKT